MARGATPSTNFTSFNDSWKIHAIRGQKNTGKDEFSSMLPAPMRSLFFSLPALACVAFFVSCKPAAPVAAQRVPETAIYEGRGVLQKMDLAGRKAVIALEEIPGYMAAMTMEFDVPDAAAAALERGDVVSFRLAVTPTHGWIERLAKVGHTELAPEPPRAVVEPGAALPDCALVDERGQRFSLGECRGRVLAFTFIYTRCPFPDFCPLLANRFGEVQRALAGAGDGWRLLSITIDPARDTPAELAAYARRVGAVEGRWRFATGEPAELEKLGAQFGITIVREGAVLNHNLRTVVVDAQGRVRRIFSGNDWPAEELAAEMRRAMTAAP